MNIRIYTYTSNNPDKHGYYCELINQENNEVIYTTSVFPNENSAYLMACAIIDEMILEDQMNMVDLLGDY